ncbi:MAG: hypothetical protein WD266_10875 [Balneolales bacterium]
MKSAGRDIILDASAGTGLLAKRIRALANPELTLTDVSDEMLAVARAVVACKDEI